MNKRLNLKQMMLGDHCATGYNQILGAILDSTGFTKPWEHAEGGWPRKSRTVIVANDSNYSLAA